jgi:hypothetical protein
MHKFRVDDEDTRAALRNRAIEPILEPLAEHERPTITANGGGWKRARPSPSAAASITPMPPSMPTERLVNALAQYLDLDGRESRRCSSATGWCSAAVTHRAAEMKNADRVHHVGGQQALTRLYFFTGFVVGLRRLRGRTRRGRY